MKSAALAHSTGGKMVDCILRQAASLHHPPAQWPNATARFHPTAQQVRLVRKLAEYESQEWQTLRYVFHLVAITDLPDQWDWLTNDYHDEAARARDDRLVFCYTWANLMDEVNLAGNQGMWLGEIGK